MLQCRIENLKKVVEKKDFADIFGYLAIALNFTEDNDVINSLKGVLATKDPTVL